MKKGLFFTLLIALTFVLTACGKDKYLGDWIYKNSSYTYTMALKEDGNWEMSRGTETREGTYTVDEKDNRTIIVLNYNSKTGAAYMELEDGKMCACRKDNCEVPDSNTKCEFYFEKEEAGSKLFNK